MCAGGSAIAAVVGGVLGVIIDASVFVFLGTILAAVAAVLVGRRLGTLDPRARGSPSRAILVVVGSGVYVLRGSDVSNYLSFLGDHAPTPSPPSTGVQTGSQRAMLLWIGWRIFEDHPLLGVGFERSATATSPISPRRSGSSRTSRRRPIPSPQNQWGVQNFWVQLLADTGVVGFALAVATFATGLVDRAPASRRAGRSSRSSRPAGSSSRPAPGTRSGSSPASRSTR